MLKNLVKVRWLALDLKKKKRGIDYWVMAILVVLMTVVVMIQVTTRLLFVPITWGEEVAKWIMIWIVFGGLGYASKDGGLISVDYFVKKLKPKSQKVTYIMNMVCTIAYFSILFVSSVSYFILLTKKGRKFPITRMPATFTVVAMLVGCILVIIFGIEQIKSIQKTHSQIREEEQ